MLCEGTLKSTKYTGNSSFSITEESQNLQFYYLLGQPYDSGMASLGGDFGKLLRSD